MAAVNLLRIDANEQTIRVFVNKDYYTLDRIGLLAQVITELETSKQVLLKQYQKLGIGVNYDF